MPDITVRYATMADVEAFQEMFKDDPGRMPKLENTIRAWVVERAGQLECIAGLEFGQGYTLAFSNTRPGMEAPKKTIWRYARLLAERIRALKIPAIALAKHEPDSSKFLESMGFTYAMTEETTNTKVFRI